MGPSTKALAIATSPPEGEVGDAPLNAKEPEAIALFAGVTIVWGAYSEAVSLP